MDKQPIWDQTSGIPGRASSPDVPKDPVTLFDEAVAVLDNGGLTRAPAQATEYLDINPIEELIKAIEIVDGKAHADIWRGIVARLKQKATADQNPVDNAPRTTRGRYMRPRR